MRATRSDLRALALAEETNMAKRIGFIGAGLMGHGMAKATG
jgi:predicted homoserine dehydrogenase-like protein